MAIRFRIADTARGSMELLRHRTRWYAVILMTIILFVFLTILYVTKILIDVPLQPEFVVYRGEADEEVEQTQPKQRDILGGRALVAPPVTPVITAATDFAHPSFSMDANMEAPTMTTDGIDALSGSDLGDGMGEGSEHGGMGGKKVDSAFVGCFWDLKRTADGKESDYGKSKGVDLLLAFGSDFYNGGWDCGKLAKFMQAKMQLYNTCFFMPNCKDEEAVHAYDHTGKQGLKKGSWLVVYRAKVKAPVSGTFRFVGAADTVMGVRFDGHNVLACGLHNLRNATAYEWRRDAEGKKKRLLVQYEGTEAGNENLGGFEVGDPVTVEAGKWYEMQVMISEFGGGEFGFCLLVDEQGTEKRTTKDGKPLFQLFRTDFSAPTTESAYEAILDENKSGDIPLIKEIPYDPDSRVWVAKPVDVSVKMK